MPHALARIPSGRRDGPAAKAALALLAALSAALLASGCGGTGRAERDGDRPAAAEQRSRLNGADAPRASLFPKPERGQTLQAFADSIGATGTQVGLATSVFTPGPNRLAFGVLGENNAFVYGPTAVYVAPSPQSKEVDGPYLAPADLLVTEPPFRSEQAATEDDSFAAVYQAEDVKFTEPGDWYVLVVTQVGADLVAAPTGIQVRRSSPVPEPGERAPVVETDTVVEAGSIEAIETRRPPDDMHDVSFKDVVGRKPVALLFATPQLCRSQVCGPVVDIALQLQQKYGDRVEFIHQEVYVDNDPKKGLRPPLRRYGLPSEPWLFTVDRDGRIAARLEGSFGLKAFDAAVRAAL